MDHLKSNPSLTTLSLVQTVEEGLNCMTLTMKTLRSLEIFVITNRQVKTQPATGR